ncbi:MAG: rRNA ((2251)-2-O)-methyltransferase RlmB [Ilumatobacteraceae bacterium]|nr:rRNA ((2251)-2-O)-methyltransferase RlmB [Ilumatobacteraceae bacterium]
MKPTSAKGSSNKRSGKGTGKGIAQAAARTSAARTAARSGGAPSDRPKSSDRSKASGAKQFSSRGAGRTGRVTPTGEPPRVAKKTLGGEQVEGRQAVRELLIAGKRRVREIWVASDLDDNEIVADIVEIAKADRVMVQYVARKRLEAAAKTESPQGVIAYADGVPEADFTTLIKRVPGRVPFLVAVDGVTDPGNLGALLRSCEGAGVHAVVLPRHRAVHVTPTVAKAAAGAVEYVPMAMVGGLPQALAMMKEAGIWVVGLDDAADRDLFDIGDLAAEAICLVMGAEGAGLSRLVRERCDMIVSIPMLGRLSSLNVSAAAALAAYEIARARRPSKRSAT